MAITFGDASAPSQKTVNFDALFALTVANSKRNLQNAIATSNPLFSMLFSGEAYEGVEGGTNLEEPILYELGSFDWYDGYDELSTAPTDGVTNSVWEWRQAAIPIAISGKEERINRGRAQISSLMKTKMTQARLGIREGIPKAMYRGNQPNGGLISDNPIGASGATGIEPIARLIPIDPTASSVVGNIQQSTNAWWQSKAVAATGITTKLQLLEKVNTLINECAKGGGGAEGKPNLLVSDQTTFELLTFALWEKFRITRNEETPEFPFESVRFRGITITWDEFMHDAQNGAIDTTTAGTLYAFNTRFMKIKYNTMANFITTEFKQPSRQDAKSAHILWMGNFTVSNRRKLGVLYNIPRTLT